MEGVVCSETRPSPASRTAFPILATSAIVCGSLTLEGLMNRRMLLEAATILSYWLLHRLLTQARLKNSPYRSGKCT